MKKTSEKLQVFFFSSSFFPHPFLNHKARGASSVRFPIYILGNSGGVVNSLDFCPASLKSLGCFYFRCVLSSQSQWKAVTSNLRILHCQL